MNSIGPAMRWAPVEDDAAMNPTGSACDGERQMLFTAGMTPEAVVTVRHVSSVSSVAPGRSRTERRHEHERQQRQNVEQARGRSERGELRPGRDRPKPPLPPCVRPGVVAEQQPAHERTTMRTRAAAIRWRLQTPYCGGITGSR
jgi:hypothetical protein